MKKIAVLGANGYIARNIIHVLEKEYPDSELKLYGIENNSIDLKCNYTQVDMSEKESTARISMDCDIIFMFVGKTGSVDSLERADTFININERTLLNLLNEYRRQGSHARIIFPSTRLVYKGAAGPQKEDNEKEFKTVYAINKYACEQYLKQFHEVYDIQYTVFRICLPYGTLVPGASSYGTAEFMLSKAQNGKNITLYGDGSVRRTLTYMGDLCKDIISGAMSENCANDVFNIGGEDYSLREMAELIAAKYGVGIDYIPWPEVALKIESGDTVFDAQKLDKAIGSRVNTRFIDWINGRVL